jgi:hypothetical protein
LLGVVGERAESGVLGGEELEFVVGDGGARPGRLSWASDAMRVELPAVEIGAVFVDPLAGSDTIARRPRSMTLSAAEIAGASWSNMP